MPDDHHVAARFPDAPDRRGNRVIGAQVGKLDHFFAKADRPRQDTSALDGAHSIAVPDRPHAQAQRLEEIYLRVIGRGD